VPRRGNDPVRCLAARAEICMEGHPRTFEYAAALFDHQQSLSPDMIYALAEPYRPRRELERCVGSAETQAHLEEDAREASRHPFEGTPLVLVNGRKASPSGAFLFAMILTRGEPWHPAFAGLPPPRAPGAP
jgi:serine/threonine-protein kinase